MKYVIWNILNIQLKLIFCQKFETVSGCFLVLKIALRNGESMDIISSLNGVLRFPGVDIERFVL